MLEILLKNGLDPNRHLGGRNSNTAASWFAYYLNEQTKLTRQSSGYIPTRHALRRCLIVFYEYADMSEARYQGQPLVLYVNRSDRPALVRAGTELSAAFGYARNHGLEYDLHQLLSFTNGVFDGEPIFPIIVPNGDRIRLADPRTQAIHRLHEKIVPKLSPLKTQRWRSEPDSPRRFPLPGYDETDQSWLLPKDADVAAFFDLQLQYVP